MRKFDPTGISVPEQFSSQEPSTIPGDFTASSHLSISYRLHRGLRRGNVAEHNRASWLFSASPNPPTLARRAQTYWNALHPCVRIKAWWITATQPPKQTPPLLQTPWWYRVMQYRLMPGVRYNARTHGWTSLKTHTRAHSQGPLRSARSRVFEFVQDRGRSSYPPASVLFSMSKGTLYQSYALTGICLTKL